MASKQHGLGIDNGSPAAAVTPSPIIIQHYFTGELHYFVDCDKNGKKNIFSEEKISRYVHYKNILNKNDHPLFAELKDITCISHIIIDMYTGTVKKHYFEVRFNGVGWCPGIEALRGVEINSFARLAKFEDKELGAPTLIWVFRWHLNIVHMTREYLKGGWMERPRRVKELEKAKGARKYLNKFGLTDIINNAKPSSEDLFKPLPTREVN